MESSALPNIHKGNPISYFIKAIALTSAISVSTEISARVEGIINKVSPISKIQSIIPDNWDKKSILLLQRIELEDTQSKYQKILAQKYSIGEQLWNELYPYIELMDFIQWTKVIYIDNFHLFQLYSSLTDDIKIDSTYPYLQEQNKANLNYTLWFLLSETEEILKENKISSQYIIRKILDQYPKIFESDLKILYMKAVLKNIHLLPFLKIQDKMVLQANIIIKQLNKKERLSD